MQPKELTDRSAWTFRHIHCTDADKTAVWTNLRPKLEERIVLARQQRLEEDLLHRIEEREHQIVAFYDEYVAANVPADQRDLMPNAYDMCALPCIKALSTQNDARGDVAREDFEAVVAQLLVEAEEYKAHAMRALVDLACKNNRSLREALEGVPPEDALQRWFAYFTCIGPGCSGPTSPRAATFREMHAHWRTAHSHKTWLGTINHELGIPWETVQTTYEVPKIGKAAMVANGISLDTTQSVLNEWVRTGRLYCVCGDPSLPLPTELNWIDLVSVVCDDERILIVSGRLSSGRFSTCLDT